MNIHTALTLSFLSISGSIRSERAEFTVVSILLCAVQHHHHHLLLLLLLPKLLSLLMLLLLLLPSRILPYPLPSAAASPPSCRVRAAGTRKRAIEQLRAPRG